MRGERDCEFNLLSSLCILIISFLMLSVPIMDVTIKPLFRDGSIISMGRYSMTQDALDTIQQDGKKSVIAIGSSMMFKAFNGSCFDELDQKADVNYYNLAIPNSRPYNDMLHIPKIIKTKPEIVMIEIGVNTLDNPSSSAEDYIEFRYKMDTMLQDDSDIGGWLPIIEDEYGDWIATDFIERQIFKQKWYPEAIEELSNRLILDKSGVYPYSTYAQIPNPDDSEWLSFLQEPEWPPIRFDKMTFEEAEEYNQTEMPKSALLYHPVDGNTLSHEAIEYMITELTNNNIQVVIASMPHHPLIFQYLEPGQWDGFNETLDRISLMNRVTIIENTWSQGWTHEHFDDRNHLDGDGRAEFCRRTVPVISGLFDTDSPSDLDGDGVEDNSDAFPNDYYEQSDLDGDGIGDNSDIWPNDSSYAFDSDEDGIPDEIDLCYSPIILNDQNDFTDYQITENGCYNVLPEEGVYILSGGVCKSSLCNVNNISPELDYTILTVKYTVEKPIWVDYNDNNESESWERNYDDMFVWFNFEFKLDNDWYEEKLEHNLTLKDKYSKQFMFNYIDNSSGNQLSHLVEISPCVDTIDSDELIGPIRPLQSVHYVNLANTITAIDPFAITTNQNQSWTKLSNIPESFVGICN